MSVKVGIIASSRGTAAPPVGLLLDAYPGAAAAYSFRKLRTAYNGACIRVARTSLGGELDIGFVNNVLDITTLLSFVGIGDGIVTIWYDQSGNGNNATEFNTNNAPRIVIGGMLITDGGKVAMTKVSVMALNNPISINPNNACFAVMSRQTSTGFLASFVAADFNSPVFSLAYSNGNLYNANTTNTAFYPFTQTGRFLFSTQNVSNNLSVYKNNVIQSLTPSPQDPILPVTRLFVRNGVFEPFEVTGKVQEQILYNTNQFANNTGINTNINTFYTIY